MLSCSKFQQRQLEDKSYARRVRLARRIPESSNSDPLGLVGHRPDSAEPVGRRRRRRVERLVTDLG